MYCPIGGCISVNLDKLHLDKFKSSKTMRVEPKFKCPNLPSTTVNLDKEPFWLLKSTLV